MKTILPGGIRWILFDAVGTLMYADPPVAEAYHAAGREFGSQLGIDEIRRRFAVALVASQHEDCATSELREQERWRGIVREVMDDIPHRAEAIFQRLWRHFAQPEHWRLYDDVPHALADLKRRGFRLGIASNFDRRLLDIVKGHPPLAACEKVFIASEIGFTKPAEGFFRQIETRLEASPGEIALVGDDEASDARGAKAAGWKAVRLRREEAAFPNGIHTLAEFF